MVIVFSFLSNGSWDIVLLALYAAGSFLLFNSTNKVLNFHSFIIHKLEVV